MSGLLDELDDHQDHEITLGTGALLAIFFGVVLLCAVFFGLGYSLGRHSGEPAVGTKTHSVGSKPSDTDSANVSTPDSATAEKPSATANSAKAPIHTSAAPSPTAGDASVSSIPARGASVAKGQIMVQPKGQIMVQLMAATQMEDAQVLATALNKRGYSAVVRSEPDRLFHVQVGPFATRSEADAMRRKLQSDGYNAILK